jgi:hypothetical protein
MARARVCAGGLTRLGVGEGGRGSLGRVLAFVGPPPRGNGVGGGCSHARLGIYRLAPVRRTNVTSYATGFISLRVQRLSDETSDAGSPGSNSLLLLVPSLRNPFSSG